MIPTLNPTMKPPINPTMKHILTLILTALLLAPLAAQETRGQINGVVSDAQSAAVVGAAIAVINTDTDVRRDLITNQGGYYEAGLLLPGRYVVSVEAPGFKKSIRSGLVLPVGSTLAVNIQLEVGAQAESISVTAEAPLLDPGATSAAGIVDRRTVMDLPVMGNNPALITKLMPGVQTPGVNRLTLLGYVGASSEYRLPESVGGNQWSIDGAPVFAAGRGMAYMPFSDAVQEMKVETSPFDASVGHTTGINIIMMTKAGTNALHGTATEQYGNTRWNGASFFVKQQKYRQIAQARAAGDLDLADRIGRQDVTPKGHSHNWAGTIGGPVFIPKIMDGRNKLFFFFSYAGVRDRRPEDPQGINYTVPTLANRQGDFSDLLGVDAVRYQIYDPLSVRPDPARPTHYIRDPFQGNRIPAARRINPLYDKYVKFVLLSTPIGPL